MEEPHIHILGIAPYEGMKTAMARAAESYPNVTLDIAIGDLDEGAAIVQALPRDRYDCVISRGGTAERIRQVSSLPVIDIKLSVYDVLRSIKLAENYGGRYAVVGFPSITEPAHILCDLLRYDLDIITIHSREDVVSTLTQLQRTGYRMVVSDMVTHTAARQMGMDAFLITSGAESLRTALDQAISFSKGFRRIRQENLILRSMNQDEVSMVLLDRKGNLCYAQPADPAAELLSTLRSHLKEVAPGRSLSFYYKNLNTLYGITARQIRMWENTYVLFTCRPGQIPLRGSKLGMRSYGRAECDHLFMSSFYSISGAMGEVESTVSAFALSQQSVLIAGENGTGKEQIARALYLRSGQTNSPFWVFNCNPLLGVQLQAAGGKKLGFSPESPQLSLQRLPQHPVFPILRDPAGKQAPAAADRDSGDGSGQASAADFLLHLPGGRRPASAGAEGHPGSGLPDPAAARPADPVGRDSLPGQPVSEQPEPGTGQADLRL